MRKMRYHAAAAVAAALYLGVGTPASAQAASTDPTAAVTSGTLITSEVSALAAENGGDAKRALESYWTPKKMRSATPPPATQLSTEALQQARTAAGATGKTAGSPTRIAPAAGTAAAAARPAATEAGYPVGHPTARTSGKVFYDTVNSRGRVTGHYVCSGTVVNSEGKSVVWTAGHCVSSAGRWHANWVFVPNYHDGQAPYGHWSATRLSTTQGWQRNNQDWANDVGAAVMASRNGQRIADALGAQGLSWNEPVEKSVLAVGYPQLAPFNGQRLWTEQNTTHDGTRYLPRTINMTNHMTAGSSGGAWLSNISGQFGTVTGHNDFKIDIYPRLMFSPYYADQAEHVYNSVRNDVG